MDLLNKNINILSTNPNHWIGEYKETLNSIDILDKDSIGNEQFIINKKLFSISDKFDEEQCPNNLKRELIFVIGLFSVNEIKMLYQNMSKESFLVILEPNKSFFNFVLCEKDLSIFKSLNLILFADDLINLPFFLDNLFSTSLIYYIKNIRFYFTEYYRLDCLDTSTLIIKEIKETIKYKTIVYGNSIEDSLTGFMHNIKNSKYLIQSKDVSLLKNTFKNIPAVIVAAGPSLNKNIQELKKMKTKAIIIAVDTIASRLHDEGIIPDFICSIEREKETYTYFYEGKNYSEDTTLIGPLLLHPKIFEEFKGDLVIPMRENVGEYIWLQDTFGFSGDNSISIGLSCAHVAFGFAEHIGASPIVLVGQDLAFGSSKEESHAEGTIYDEKEFTNNTFSTINEITVEGYYGNNVRSTDIWMSFRKWFEKEIVEKKLIVINATEGGAKIANSIQMSLVNVIEEYCSETNIIVKDVLNSISSYPINEEQMKLALSQQKNILQELKNKFEKQLKTIQKLKINNNSTKKELLKVLNKLQISDQLFKIVNENWLLRHNLQPILMTTIWNLYSIDQVLSAENLNRNKEIQLEFLTVGVFVLNELILIIDQSLMNSV
ncbi:6-hydroxymethylpterin diphosphokinase MptE-like protein [Bacillus sp. 37MA]|uniref:motility associated factor glycosyltransferase family protein n=1 Tax=Bacillus sp. 37MA TaxID=1132442 RepID=UPI0003643812|nr:6-hydroxymethylpterin diphosphokinase MptE-like protein [Bacillus sp. 37MA]